jgi:hypothetical protein
MQPQVTKTEFTCKLITIRSKRSFAEVTSALEVRPPVRQPSGRVRPRCQCAPEVCWRRGVLAGGVAAEERVQRGEP